ncbi:D-tagatose-bisphosphate aldolase, class II, non-catalytic subunit [Algicella marina]|uniref:D-tagatose-bisphosphate aldolase, class II, non-catalytic subunit n=1 Tax=Algicella marina TaxID=2683284 RepID=A0A6P1SXC7_9RHOB|nr:D-tagatose-bisphosphate aldolase, class II, non-catalytic subunit [Algicella marina]QHQ35108.1 D-tagatose-bisphosphate aldolase, class II, non-catalytic subunit [Algicella marina]
MSRVTLTDLASLYHGGKPKGITSVCSAHPLVLRAALRHGRETGATVLIEATCNQVNHLGGYTGMTPQDFATLVHSIAAEEACPPELVILGGDHLGPNPWRDQRADAAMLQAERMVAAFVAAGFAKIHLDASMGCAGEPVALDDVATANRAARLAAVAERTARDAGVPPPLYIIGTEVPPPGGADHALAEIRPTDPDAARHTLAVHRQAFADNGLDDAFSRVIGLVVQPGVEFGNRNVIAYDPAPARGLVAALAEEPGIIFEAHSTDYQGTEPLSRLVQDGFAILKVGPELTFVLREALYALDLIASDLLPGYGTRPLYSEMERLMLASPDHWRSHYQGTAGDERMLRHYSLSDRIRYYWTRKEAMQAVARLIHALRGQLVPLPLIRQHLPQAEAFAAHPLEPEDLLVDRITDTLRSYHTACAV